MKQFDVLSLAPDYIGRSSSKPRIFSCLTHSDERHSCKKMLCEQGITEMIEAWLEDGRLRLVKTQSFWFALIYELNLGICWKIHLLSLTDALISEIL